MRVRLPADPARLAAPAAALCLLAAGCIPFRPVKPAAPGSLLASPTSARSITLIWVANSRDEQGFRVERIDPQTDAQGQKSERITPVARAARGAVRCEVTGLEPKTEYRFRLIAFNAAGDSLPSEVAAVTTQGLSLEDAIAQCKPAVFLVRNTKNMSFLSTGQEYEFGTGFVIGGKRLATNEHVIHDARDVAVRVNGTWLAANAVISDASNDVAIVEVPSATLPEPLNLGDSDALRDGAGIVAIGFPKVTVLTDAGFDIAPSSVPGTVSAIRDQQVPDASGSLLSRYFPTKHKQIQMNAPINEGNSGGPVVEIGTGKVVGLTVSHLRDAEGIKFAVPVNYLKQLMGQEVLSGLTRAPGGTETDFFSRWRERRYRGLSGPFGSDLNNGPGSGSGNAPFSPDPNAPPWRRYGP